MNSLILTERSKSPITQELSTTTILISLVNSLNDLLKKIPTESLPENEISNHFCGKKPTKIPLIEYAARLQKCINSEVTSLICAIIYLDRLCQKNKIKVSPMNVHRMLFVSIVLSVKFNEDEHFSNSTFAKIGGVSVERLVEMEAAYLEGLDFSLFVEKVEFDVYKNYLCLKA